MRGSPETRARFHGEFLRDRPELVKGMRRGAGGRLEGGKNRMKGKECADELKKLAANTVER